MQSGGIRRIDPSAMKCRGRMIIITPAVNRRAARQTVRKQKKHEKMLERNAEAKAAYEAEVEATRQRYRLQQQIKEAYAIPLREVIGPLGAKQVAATAKCSTLGDVAKKSNGFHNLSIPGIGPVRAAVILEWATSLDLVA